MKNSFTKATVDAEQENRLSDLIDTIYGLEKRRDLLTGELTRVEDILLHCVESFFMLQAKTDKFISRNFSIGAIEAAVALEDMIRHQQQHESVSGHYLQRMEDFLAAYKIWNDELNGVNKEFNRFRITKATRKEINRGYVKLQDLNDTGFFKRAYKNEKYFLKLRKDNEELFKDMERIKKALNALAENSNRATERKGNRYVETPGDYAELKDTYLQLLTKYTIHDGICNELWKELETLYLEKARHYHSFAHLAQMLRELNTVKDHLDDWETVLFALYYHDAIYKTSGKGNEEESVALARRHLERIHYPESKINKCEKIILATKRHPVTGDKDTDYFTDADLSILGQAADDYLSYAEQIRKEYSAYPSLLYSRGRKKILKHYVSMSRIYKTAWFFDKYEIQARENLKRELSH
jgi:predicted metal-dependent HD superfamily phosphohydrolase